MKITTLFAGCALAAVSLSGCASANGVGAALLNDLQGCHRHYTGAIAPGNVLAPIAFTGAVEIDCPQGISTGVLVPPATPAPVPVAPTPQLPPVAH